MTQEIRLSVGSKPTLRKFTRLWYICEGNGVDGFGMSPVVAYKNWEINGGGKQ